MKKFFFYSARQVRKKSKYFNLHFYRLIKIIHIILDRKNDQQKEKLLEIGVWPGYLFLFFKKIGFNVLGIDLNPKRIKKINFHQTIINYDLNTTPLKIPFPDSYFHWIVVSEVIEHLNPQNLSPLFNEINRLLKNKGLVLITTPNKNSLHNFIFRKKNLTIKDGHGHIREYSIQELKEIVEKSSLKIIISKNTNFYSNVGSFSKNNYFYPLYIFWKYPHKFFNLLKIFSIPIKSFSFFRDSIIVLAQKND